MRGYRRFSWGGVSEVSWRLPPRALAGGLDLLFSKPIPGRSRLRRCGGCRGLLGHRKTRLERLQNVHHFSLLRFRSSDHFLPLLLGFDHLEQILAVVILVLLGFEV